VIIMLSSQNATYSAGWLLSAPPASDPVESPADERDWVALLDRLGVSAAVLSYASAGDQRRQALLMGLDTFKAMPTSLATLMAAIDRLSTRQFQQAPHLEIAQLDAPDGLATFGSALLLRAERPSATLRALFLRDHARGAFTRRHLQDLESAMPRLIELAGSHLARERSDRRYQLLENVLDRLALPILLLDADARILHANTAGHRLIGRRADLRVESDGRVGCATVARTVAFQTMIRRVANAPAGDSAPACVTWLTNEDGGPRLGYAYSALRGSNVLDRSAMLIVPVETAVRIPRVALDAVGLLPSEQRFLSHFLASDSLRQASGQCGVSEETGRTYLKRIKSKLGATRQIDLMRRLSGLAPPLDRDGDGREQSA
jgi:PAS domain-containing protein/DNA-binding CsgD family transcriptional regulator